MPLPLLIAVIAIATILCGCVAWLLVREIIGSFRASTPRPLRPSPTPAPASHTKAFIIFLLALGIGIPLAPLLRMGAAKVWRESPALRRAVLLHCLPAKVLPPMPYAEEVEDFTKKWTTRHHQLTEELRQVGERKVEMNVQRQRLEAEVAQELNRREELLRKEMAEMADAWGRYLISERYSRFDLQDPVNAEMRRQFIHEVRQLPKYANFTFEDRPVENLSHFWRRWGSNPETINTSITSWLRYERDVRQLCRLGTVEETFMVRHMLPATVPPDPTLRELMQAVAAEGPAFTDREFWNQSLIGFLIHSLIAIVATRIFWFASGSLNPLHKLALTGIPVSLYGVATFSLAAVGWLILGTIGLVVYCLPSFIAFHRQHTYRFPLLAINLLLGWTLLGYIAAMVWACWPKTSGPSLHLQVTLDRKKTEPKDESGQNPPP